MPAGPPRPPATLARAAALGGVLATAIGAGLVVAAVVADRRLWLNGYVSEAGVASSGHSTAYRIGIGAVSLGQLLFAVAVLGLPRAPARWPLPHRWRPARWPALAPWLVPATAGLLAADAAFGGVSGVVSCSPGCPLPPHDPAPAVDLVHGGASILAIGLMCLAMLALAYLCPAGPVTAVSRVAAPVLVPLVAADGIAILIVGRSDLTGMLERMVLLGAIAWALGAGIQLARRAPSR